MWPALSFCEIRQDIFFLLIIIGCLSGKYHSPARFCYHLSACLELYTGTLAKHSRGAELAVGVEHCYKVCCHKVIYLLFKVGKSLRIYSCGDNCVVVGNLLVVEHLFRLYQRLVHQWHSQCLIVAQALEYVGAFGINIIAQECCIHTWVCGNLLFVQRLYCLQCLFCRQSELLVAIDLQRCKVIQFRWKLGSVLGRYVGYSERLPCNFFECFASLLLAVETSFGNTERGVAVNSLQFPIRLWNKVRYFKMTFYYQRKGWGLYTSYGEHLSVLAVFYGVQACRIHAKQPVAYGTAQSGLIQCLIFTLVL